MDSTERTIGKNTRIVVKSRTVIKNKPAIKRETAYKKPVIKCRTAIRT